jgi:hypothetical protein
MASGLVPRMGIPASSSACASFSGSGHQTARSRRPVRP